MKKEMIQMIDVTLHNSKFEKIHHINLIVRQGENILLWGRDNTGQILARFLCGEGVVTEGRVYIDGQKLQEGSTSRNRQAVLEEHKIFYIDRNAELMNSLDLAENLFLLKKNSLRKLWINKKAMHMQAAELLERYGTMLHGWERIGQLSAVDKIAVALVRAAAQGARLIVVDNMLTNCPADDAEYLCSIIAKMEREGITFFLYDVHGESMIALADRIILVDHGEIVKKLANREEFRQRNEIVARNYKKDTASDDADRERSAKEDKSFAIHNIGYDAMHCFSITIAPGEILFVSHNDAAAQLGCFNALLGETDRRPVVRLCGRELAWRSCVDLIRERIAFWGDKKDSSALFYNLTVEDNILMPSLKRISRGGFYQKRADFIMQDDFIQAENLLHTDVESLSEKAVMELTVYKWMLFHPKLLIVHNILSRLDEELKEWTSEKLRLMAKRGTAIILLETAVDDAMYLADRMLVVKQGVQVGEVLRQGFASYKIEELL